RRKQEVRQIEGNRKMAVAVEKAEDRGRHGGAAPEGVAVPRDVAQRVRQGGAAETPDEQKLEAHKLTAKSYSLKLQRVGDTHRSLADTQPQKNSRLKTSIQSSLKVQLEDRRRREAGEMDEAISAKLQAASERRRAALLGSRYGLVESGRSASRLRASTPGSRSAWTGARGPGGTAWRAPPACWACWSTACARWPRRPAPTSPWRACWTRAPWPTQAWPTP
ncbi:unnamed protein product, partial [Prorocentrum cordatum]